MADDLMKKEACVETLTGLQYKSFAEFTRSQVAGHKITRSQSHRFSQRILPHGLNTRPEAKGGGFDAMLLWEPMSI